MNAAITSQPSAMSALEASVKDALASDPGAESWGQTLALALLSHSDPRAVLQALLLQVTAARVPATALLSESALEDWNRPEEEAAWSYLQPKK